MIDGWATEEGCGRFFSRNPDVVTAPLGTTGLVVSRAGFGCYRVAGGVPSHEAALRLALTAGINLIDTSANYTDGQSETVVGGLLTELVQSGELAREEVVIVTKGGYLQGENLTLSRERAAQGNPFEEVVPYDSDLAHCIHPDFLSDQIERSRRRLGLATLDGYLLHNPEYYLGWVEKKKKPLAEAREEYYRRIRQAFEYLERAVADGRIRFYGISSNTFPADFGDPQFTELARVWEIAAGLSAEHHFRLIQMPLNLLEPGAVVEKNQPGSRSVLALAAEKGLGVLINRPLNAFSGGQMVRLADVPAGRRQDTNEIIRKIRAVTKSEGILWSRLAPGLELPTGLRLRIKEQLAIGDVLKHYWKNFGGYDRLRQAIAVMFMPRVAGVMDFLRQQAPDKEELAEWMAAHRQVLQRAFDAVASVYIEEAAHRSRQVSERVAGASEAWAQEAALSRRAIRAVLDAPAVTAALVGMRQEAYVRDVLAVLAGTGEVEERSLEAWETLAGGG